MGADPRTQPWICNKILEGHIGVQEQDLHGKVGISVHRASPFGATQLTEHGEIKEAFPDGIAGLQRGQSQDC